MKPINVAILHHHLRGGGVTRVIDRCLQALAPHPVNICIIVGEEGALDEAIIGVVEGLSYGSDVPRRSVPDVKQEARQKAEILLNGKVDIWHFHNHSLGKNSLFTELALSLVEDGEKVVLQIHDFAEDNRPGNYKLLKDAKKRAEEPLIKQVYPIANHIEYAVLNARDENILKGAGIPEEKVRILSNPVVMENSKKSGNSVSISEDETKLLIYPVRAIPRKNIGEIALWAALNESRVHFGITLAPKNPKYKIHYKKWVSFCEEHDLPVTFEPGKKWGLSFEELLESADGIITTSMQEGFGLAFLENWLIEKPLYGRLLKDITKDFSEAGIEYSGMYTKLPIPLHWLDKEEVHEELKLGIKEVLSKYERYSEATITQWIEELTKDELIDFGILSQRLQQKVILKVLENPELKEQIPVLLRVKTEEEVLTKNRKIVEEKFNLENYGTKLFSMYRDLMSIEAGNVDFADSSKVLDEFLSPNQFTLLRG